MKKYVGIIVFCMSSLAGEQDSVIVTKGALVEGLFILQNKYVAVKEAIQELKKEVAECSQGKSAAQVPSMHSYEMYHAKLKQLLYPAYIDELAHLTTLLEKDIALMNSTQPLPKEVFEEIMRRAFVIYEKIESEKKLVSKIFEVDRQESELRALQQMHDTYRKEEGRRQVSNLAALVAKGREEVAALRISLIGINNELYSRDLKQQVFLNRLAFRRK